MKTKTKILLLLAIMLITTCVLSINTVKATNVITNETSTSTVSTKSTTSADTTISNEEDLLNLIPNTISLDILESEALIKTLNYYGDEDEKRVVLANTEIEKILSSKGITLPYELPEKTENGITTKTTLDNVVVVGNEDIHKIQVYVTSSIVTSSSHGGAGGSSPLEQCPNKKIVVKYSNSDKANSTDKQYIENKISNIDFNQYLGIDNFGPDIYINNQFDTNTYIKSIEKLLNDNSIDVVVEDTTMYFGNYGHKYDFLFRFYKDDIFYASKIGHCFVFNLITVPENIANTDEAYCNYAVQWCNENNSNFTLNGDITCSKLPTFNADEEGWREYPTSIYPKQYNNDLYALKGDNGTMFVMLKKATTTQAVKGVIINNANVTISTEKIENTSDLYKEMQNKLNAKGYKDILNAYELKLTSGDLGDGLEITFDIGTKYNAKKAIVLHQKQDGTYEEFEKNVENGKIKITVTELSPFMIAVKDNATTNNKVLDNEPKTGVGDYTIFASVIALISLGGIATLKFKK